MKTRMSGLPDGTPVTRVCLVHNHYQQPGGEDAVFIAEGQLLEAHSVCVRRATVHNDDLNSMGGWERAARTIWNDSRRRWLSDILRASKSQLAHFHNTFPLLSPAVYTAAHECGIPVVQTLHNFRLLCANALFFRDGKPCEDCIGRRIAWPGVVHACYRQNRAASATVAAMTGLHRALGTWHEDVDAYIALSEFSRAKFIQGGLPAEKIHVKPNFLAEDPGFCAAAGTYALYVGRLSGEKGIDVLMDAWRRLGGRIPLKVVGDGPLKSTVACVPGVEWLGRRQKSEVLDFMRGARLLVFPSLCYENFPTVLVEAMAIGLPAVASRSGAAETIVLDGQTGMQFDAADPECLARVVRGMWDATALLRDLRYGARARFLEAYTADINYRQLMMIYDAAQRSRLAKGSSRLRWRP